MRALPLLPLVLLIGGLLILAPWPGAQAEDEVAPPAPPGSLTELGERLAQLQLRVDRLIVEANKDPDERKIRIYNNYTPDELKLKRRSVHAEMLVDYMLDPEKNHNVRDMASEAIYKGATSRGDPELSQTEKQGRVSRRAYFCEKYLIKHLRHDDAAARKFTHELLLRLWRVSNIPGIARYKPNDEKTHKTAYNEWKKYLRRQ